MHRAATAVLLFWTPLALFAADAGLEIRAFAGRIVQTAGAGPVYFQYSGGTPLRDALSRELVARGLPAANAPGARQCRITFSSSLTRQVWTADLHLDQERRIVVHEFAVEAPADSTSTSTAYRIVLERTLLFEDAHPILDVMADPERLVVLQPARLLVRTAGGTEAMTLTLSRPAPRDPRGRLVATQAGVKALLFNGTCESTPGLYCRDEVEPWPLDGVDALPAAGTNYFQGGFYSVAQASGTRYSARREFRGRTFGDDLAALDSQCGRWVVASSPRPQEENDALRAHDPSSFEPVSEPMELPGPVTALWPSGASVIAVSRNRASGTYAAYRLSARCLR